MQRVASMACLNAHASHRNDRVAVDGDCGPNACLPEDAPCDDTLRCCDGLACAAGTCVDVDACEDHACDAHATCSDSPPPAGDDASGRACVCGAGYEGDGEPGGCRDIDACLSHQCGPNAVCSDAPAPAPDGAAGRTCVCADGYEGDPEAGCTVIASGQQLALPYGKGAWTLHVHTGQIVLRNLLPYDMLRRNANGGMNVQWVSTTAGPAAGNAAGIDECVKAGWLYYFDACKSAVNMGTEVTDEEWQQWKAAAILMNAPWEDLYTASP